jgi:ATP-binding cassette subfamily F protein uup
MADPQLFAKDPKKIESSSIRFGKASQELAKAEEEWLELEILREELAAR